MIACSIKLLNPGAKRQSARFIAVGWESGKEGAELEKVLMRIELTNDVNVMVAGEQPNASPRFKPDRVGTLTDVA